MIIKSSLRMSSNTTITKSKDISIFKIKIIGILLSVIVEDTWVLLSLISLDIPKYR